MTDWFHDPASLRAKADEFDRLAAAEPADRANIAGAWLGKARALRSRAGAIDRMNTSLLRHIQDMSDRDLEHANEEALAFEFKTTRAVVRAALRAARQHRNIGEWR